MSSLSEQRAHELLTVLGERAPFWFDFDDQLVVFQALDDLTDQGRDVIDVVPFPAAEDDAELALLELKACLQDMLCAADGLPALLRYTRVIDLVASIRPKQCPP